MNKDLEELRKFSQVLSIPENDSLDDHYLSYGECDQLDQLVRFMPVEDGNLISKGERDWMVKAGLAWRKNGINGATLKGMLMWLLSSDMIRFRTNYKS